MTKNLKIPITISILFLGLIRFTPVWERYPGGLWNVLFYLSIVILFFWLIIYIIKEVIGFIKFREKLPYKSFFPILIMTTALLDGIFNPLKINFDSIYGQVIFKACYEGTQNQATFKLRDGNRFELHWTGVFFYNEYFNGTYIQVGDTLFLSYQGKKPERFGEKLLMDNDQELLITIQEDIDGLNNVVPFYFGYCRGLN